jgi:hypothetical protein
VIQLVGSFVIGIYVGILVDPWFRAWVTQNEWARQARESEDLDPSLNLSRQISCDDYEWLANQPADSSSEVSLPDEQS